MWVWSGGLALVRSETAMLASGFFTVVDFATGSALNLTCQKRECCSAVLTVHVHVSRESSNPSNPRCCALQAKVACLRCCFASSNQRQAAVKLTVWTFK